MLCSEITHCVTAFAFLKKLKVIHTKGIIVLLGIDMFFLVFLCTCSHYWRVIQIMFEFNIFVDSIGNILSHLTVIRRSHVSFHCVCIFCMLSFNPFYSHFCLRISIELIYQKYSNRNENRHTYWKDFLYPHKVIQIELILTYDSELRHDKCIWHDMICVILFYSGVFNVRKSVCVCLLVKERLAFECEISTL